MKKAFSNFRINKNVGRKGVNMLMKNIHKRTTVNSIVVFTPVNQIEDKPQENWFIERTKKGTFKYFCLDRREESLKTAILNSLAQSESIVVVIICDMNQKLNKNKSIKEMWGYKVANKGKETTFEEVSSEDIYKFSTTNIHTGKSIPAKAEIVYCGPDGKICGWDML